MRGYGAQVVARIQKSHYLLGLGFFGQTGSLREEFLEEAYLLQRHLGMSYTEIKRLPVAYRRWFLERLVKEFNEKEEAMKEQRSKGSFRRDIPMGEMAELHFSDNSGKE